VRRQQNLLRDHANVPALPKLSLVVPFKDLNPAAQTGLKHRFKAYLEEAIRPARRRWQAQKLGNVWSKPEKLSPRRLPATKELFDVAGERLGEPAGSQKSPKSTN